MRHRHQPAPEASSGVQAVHIDLHSHRVDVDYDPRRLDVEDILVTVGGAGVTASVISEDS
ncbi:hypothetical protein GCM10007368_24460 [Isoptericola cucumis]|uniref:Uncharacterized protein n=1 Tax=Isoptericola cucumis TaxID=1776856 RepID=A0ABQ2B8C4_9MICO|nr:hypothetical protein GCM10007368_24460 [Isoptericola cucumis]